jgi:hypothetical protein
MIMKLKIRGQGPRGCRACEKRKKEYKDINHGPSFSAACINMIFMIKRNSLAGHTNSMSTGASFLAVTNGRTTRHLFLSFIKHKNKDASTN